MSTNATFRIVKLDFAAALFYFEVSFCSYSSVNVMYTRCNVVHGVIYLSMGMSNQKILYMAFQLLKQFLSYIT